MKALSGYAEWFWLLARGWKDVENRPWYLHMAPLLNYPPRTVRIYLHASKTKCFDGQDSAFVAERLTDEQFEEFCAVDFDCYRGAVIGEIDITGCVGRSNSPWFTGPYAFTVANPVLYDNPIPCKGRQRFFEVNINIKEASIETNPVRQV